MSSQQIQRSISDVIAIDNSQDQDWSKGQFKKLFGATSTLYNASMNKIMLKQDEETARCHICAYMACERLAEKYSTDLQFYMDRIPLEPKKVRNLLNIFKSQLFQMSPVKNISWSPSPKKLRAKSKSPVKNQERFVARDPAELRKELFDTPTKQKRLPQTEPMIADILTTGANESPITPRRKLAFEEDGSEDDEDYKNISNTPMKGSIFSEMNDKDTNDNGLNDLVKVANDRLDDNAEPSQKKRQRINPQKPSPRKLKNKEKDYNLLVKRYYKALPSEVIDLCNQFELPKEVAYNILDQYLLNSSYLVCPWQLICGLVMNCIFVVFNERRKRDPRIDHLIMEKMVRLMKCSSGEEVISCIKIVKELVIGEDWFRNLQIENNYFDGLKYDQVISAKLGSMLQPNNILVNDEQFSNWKQRIEQDLALRNP